jgi:actin-related protein
MAWRDDSRRRIVIDSGSYSIRLGNASTPVPSFIYDNFIAIDRNTGSKIFGPQLENILDETKLIY